MTYFIGLDIAKHKHDCFIMNEYGEVIRDSFSFTNDAIGFGSLLDVLKALDPVQEKRIGLEATGHYGTNLKIFLEENEYSFMEINPILIARFSKATTLRRTKTDKIDARLIALFLSTCNYKPYPLKSYHVRTMKSLCRMRESLVKERSLHLVKIARMNCDSYNKMSSVLRKTISYARFLELKQLAKETVGNEDGILTFELELYLELFKELDSKISEVESKILEEYGNMNCHIHTIPGIGMISAAGIFSEVGNFDKFNNAYQLLAFAGLDPSRCQSGESDYNGHMVKHGSSYLRQYLMNCAEMQLVHNPKMYEYYLKKKNEGKTHRVALSHVARRLVRIIFSLERTMQTLI
ncbi:MAG: IS110 family transposase [Erysipelotrichaceae bacterium]|nr:IS110 family transposase [Erysipelotrichaceae bacterium]